MYRFPRHAVRAAVVWAMSTLLVVVSAACAGAPAAGGGKSIMEQDAPPTPELSTVEVDIEQAPPSEEKGLALEEILLQAIDQEINKLDSSTLELENFIQKLLDDKINRLNSLERVLESFNVESVLKRGYAIVQKNNKKVLSVKDIGIDDEINTILKDGTFSSKINNINPHQNEKTKQKRRNK